LTSVNESTLFVEYKKVRGTSGPICLGDSLAFVVKDREAEVPAEFSKLIRCVIGIILGIIRADADDAGILSGIVSA
jgi:hypothetical protein